MKNLTKYGMMLLVAALCVGMSSCSEDDDNDGGTGGSSSFASNNPLVKEGKMLLTRVVCYRGSSGNDYGFTVIYDDQQRPIQIKYSYENYGNVSINYTDGTISDDDGDDEKVTFTHEGYIKSYTYSDSWDDGEAYEKGTTSFSYSSRCLTKMEYKFQGFQSGEKWSGTWSVTNAWSGGNIVKSTYLDKYTEDGETDEDRGECTIEYSDLNNKFRQFTIGQSNAIELEEGEIAATGLLGLGPQKLPKKVVWDDGESSIFEYELNDDGTICQEIVTETDDEGYSYTKIYKYYYTPID